MTSYYSLVFQKLLWNGLNNIKASLQKQENIAFPFKLSVPRTCVGNFTSVLHNAFKNVKSDLKIFSY